MAFRTEPRILETAITTGTGNFTVTGVVPGYRSFSAACAANDTFEYFIEAVDASNNPTGDHEVGVGAYGGSNVIRRETVLRSSNANALVNFAAGTKFVSITDVTARYLPGRIMPLTFGMVSI